MVHGRAVVVALDRESLTRRRSSTQSHPCTPTHSHCTQFRQLLLFFSSPNRFSLRVQRTGCSRTVPLTSPPSVRVQWVIQLCRPLAHGNSTCIKRPAGFNGKILSLLTDHAIFLGTIFSLSPRFRRLSHPPPEPKCRLHNFIVTLSTSSSSFHSQNRRENFSLCTTGIRIDCLFPRPVRAASVLQPLSLGHRVLIAFPLSERGKTGRFTSNFYFLNELATEGKYTILNWRTYEKIFNQRSCVREERETGREPRERGRWQRGAK